MPNELICFIVYIVIGLILGKVMWFMLDSFDRQYSPAALLVGVVWPIGILVIIFKLVRKLIKKS